MGIGGLEIFIKTYFSHWQPPCGADKSCVIVDGNNVCYSLYNKNHTRCLGGEYKRFSHTVEEFVCKLQADFESPVFVLDGASCDQDKMTKRRQRRTESMIAMGEIQCKEEWDPKDKEHKGSVPFMIIPVFVAVLKSMNIYLHFADGEGDREIAALANHHKCPVLSSDSDFFIYRLEGGFIHFDRYCHPETKNNSLYFVKDFQRQFSLPKYELCLLIPLIAGNDFIHSQHHFDYFRFFDKNILANYKSCEQFISYSRDNWWSRSTCTVQNLQKVKRQYCDMTLPVSNPDLRPFPQWVAAKVKEGCFPTHLVQVYQNQVSLLPRVVEVICERSAWLASREIRQYIYGIMGLSTREEITEIIRKDSYPELIDDPIPPKQLVSIHKIETMENEKRQDLVLEILKCHVTSEDDIEQKFCALSEELKLPIAATFYWYQKLTCPASMAKRSYLVKSLLLGFLACSDEIQTSIQPLEPVTPATKSAHLTALHAFAEWQCVYSDAMALNRLAREPFLTTSPARLYSGEVTMYYAFISEQKENWLADFISKDSKEWELFNNLLYLVTGCDENRREGRHVCL